MLPRHEWARVPDSTPINNEDALMLTRLQSSFYDDPDKLDAESAAAKLDRAAAQRRSTIRREPSIRPGRDQSSSASLTNITRSRHEMLRARIRLQRQTEEADDHIAQLEAELEHYRRQRQRNSEQARARLVRHITEDPTLSSDAILTTNVDEDIQTNTPSADTVLLPRPARESNLRFEMGATSSTRPTSPQQPPTHIPSPPHSLSDIGRNRPVDGPLDTWETTPPLSQDFAPAWAARAALGQSARGAAAATGAIRTASAISRQGLETPPPESWENSYPPLRRVSHISPRLSPRTGVDGLGDRHRSPSPLSETHEEETWNNLLQTLDRSNGSASTATSFASMSDLLSASRTSSNQSPNTQNTSTSFGEIGTSGDETCDLPPGITEEDVRRIRERHRRTARRVTAPRRHIPEPDYIHRGRGDENAGTRIGAEMSRPARSRERLTRQEELESLQIILDRMDRREEIPEDMWAMIGLPPEFGRTDFN
ncbi:hypothetical protein H2198_008176 [Neophaeococcomyces mojaviensis]|uniref:Uncharacterized protein n=1 Tax=Neophaeococcomyces mojaviensis TaxID=3383035 RepID=A0ACC2ZYL3_9EURO|nr:hypothetical protein H2198_008176 [Knufia sp. JES_112]